MSSHHVTTASLRNEHGIGRVHGIQPCNCTGLLPQEVPAPMELEEIHQQSYGNLLHLKETFTLEVSRESRKDQAFNT